jgi:hypothetical protein
VHHGALPLMPESGAIARAFDRSCSQGLADRVKAEILFFDKRDLGRKERFFKERGYLGFAS